MAALKNNAGTSAALTARINWPACDSAARALNFTVSRFQLPATIDEKKIADNRSAERGAHDLGQPGADREDRDDQLREISERSVEERAVGRTHPIRELLGAESDPRRQRENSQTREDKQPDRTAMGDLKKNRDRDRRVQDVGDRALHSGQFTLRA